MARQVELCAPDHAGRNSGRISLVVTCSGVWRVCGAIAIVAGAACGRSTDRALASPGALRGANVLLITVDTLRQDRVGAYGNGSGLTPHIDRLAAAGVRYAHAFSPAPLTLPAHASILTGLLPRHHGVHNNTRSRLDEHVPTLATVLKRGGYRTGAFVGAFVLDGRFGLNQGFDEYTIGCLAGSVRPFILPSGGARKSSPMPGIGFCQGAWGSGLGARNRRMQPPGPRP